MKVAIKQSGGYAGEVKDLLQLDTAQMEPSVFSRSEWMSSRQPRNAMMMPHTI